MMGFDDLQKRVMELSHIRQRQYYYKVLEEAERQNVVRKVMTRGGRVAVILVPPR